MEVMVMDKVVAEILVEQQPSNTLGHPSLTVAASCSIVVAHRYAIFLLKYDSLVG